MVKLQVGHNDFVDNNGETLWFNPAGSSLTDQPDGTEVNHIIHINM